MEFNLLFTKFKSQNTLNDVNKIDDPFLYDYHEMFYCYN